MPLPRNPDSQLVPIFVQEPFVGRVPGQGEKALPGARVGQRFYVRDLEDRGRIVRYLRWDELAQVHSHYDDFVSLGPSVSAPERAFWIPLDFFGMLSRLLRHYSFGPEFKVTGVEGGDNDAHVRRIATSNRLLRMLSLSAEQVATLGDIVFRVDIEDKEDEANPDGGEIPQACIRTVHPAHFFPELDPLDSSRMISAALVWIFDTTDEQKATMALRGDMIALFEIHEPGSVAYEVWEWDGEKVGSQLRTSDFFELEDGATGIDEIPLVHMGMNTRAGEFWGRSEFDRIERIVLALENRMAQLDEVLEKHSRPKLIVGPGVLGTDGHSRLADFDVIEIEPSILEKAVKPEYLTWDMQIGAVQHAIEKLEEYLFITTETSPASFGLERDGSQVESARALRFKAHRTVNKVHDLRVSYDGAIRDVFRIAQKMENAVRAEDGMDTYPRGPISITWPDPIIEDQDAEVQNYVALKAAGLVSTQRAVRDLHNLDQAQAELEGREILQDRVDEAAAAFPPGGFEPPPAESAVETPTAPVVETVVAEPPAEDLTEEPGLGIQEDVQKTLLNGAQISSLVQIVTQVASGLLPRESGLQIIQVAFGLSADEAEEIMGEAGTEEAAPPPPQFGPGSPPPPPPAEEDEEADEEEEDEDEEA